MKTIPLFKPSLGKEEQTAILSCLKSGWLTSGPRVLDFESQISQMLEGIPVVACSSCTAALDIVFDILNIKEGEEIITPSFTFASIGNLITRRKAVPVYVDIDPKTLNLDLSLIEGLLTSKTKAIVPMDYGGNPVDLKALKDVIPDIPVILDAATSFGARFGKDIVGTLADFTCFSFYPTKMITTMEGGAIAISDKALAEKVKKASYLGISKSASERGVASGRGAWYFDIETPALKYNMTDVQASLGLEQLKKLSEFIERRKIIADRYIEQISNMKYFKLGFGEYPVNNVWNFFPLLSEHPLGRDAVMVELKNRGIGTTVNYIPLHYRSVYEKHPSSKNLPITERLFKTEITLPLYPDLALEDVDYICNQLLDLDKST